MSATLRFALLLSLSASAFAHGTGEPHVHAQTANWLLPLATLWLLGLGSAFVARRATADGRLQWLAQGMARVCSVGAALCGLAALLTANGLV